MNKPLMESFMQNMLINDNYEIAYTLKDMLDNLTVYRRDKIIDHYKFIAAPYTTVFDWKNYAVLDNYWIDDSQFALDIIVTKERYQVQFFDRSFEKQNNLTKQKNPALSLLEKINMEKEFYSKDLRYEKQFGFPEQEDNLYEFIDEVLTKLRSVSSQILTLSKTLI